MTAIVILPCPFCGDTDPSIDEIDNNLWAVVCNDCGAIGPHLTDDGGATVGAKAIELWNARKIAAEAALAAHKASAGLPLDMQHEPADFAEAKEMLRRAVAALAARPDSHVDTTPEEAAQIIIDDLMARMGFDAAWDACDDSIRQEITEEIAGVIRSAARPANVVYTKDLPRQLPHIPDSLIRQDESPAEDGLAEKWQPIATVPKDGLVDIWIRNDDGTGTRWTACYYDTICDQWRTSRPSGHLVHVAARAVTHWMHAPAAPHNSAAALGRQA